MTLATRGYDDSPETWDALVAAGPAPHVLQTWAWGTLKAQFGWRVRRVAVGDACAQVLFRPLPGGLGSLGYVPKGPVVDYQDGGSLDALLQAIRPVARRERAICLKVEPNVPQGAPAGDVPIESRLRAVGFRPSPQQVQPRRTLLVDLAPEPDQILAGMKQKTRYNIRLAARRGVTVRAGGEADLAAFYRLMAETAERDRFGIHTQAYYQAAHRLFVPEHARLLLAEHEGQLLAGLVALAFAGEAVYMYGASSDERRDLMPAYLLQWQAMLWARERGCQIYDLWGVPDEDEEKLEAEFAGRNDGLWGVYRFKRGFGGRMVRAAGAWDLVYAPLRYRLYELALRALRGRLSA